MSPYKAVYASNQELISKSSQGAHKHAKITLCTKGKLETTVIAELFGVLAETLLKIMTGPSLVTLVVRLGCKTQNNISLGR